MHHKLKRRRELFFFLVSSIFSRWPRWPWYGSISVVFSSAADDKVTASYKVQAFRQWYASKDDMTSQCHEGGSATPRPFLYEYPCVTVFNSFINHVRYIQCSLWPGLIATEKWPTIYLLEWLYILQTLEPSVIWWHQNIGHKNVTSNSPVLFEEVSSHAGQVMVKCTPPKVDQVQANSY